MRLLPQPVPDWPKLAWVACCGDRSGEVRVLHGPMVETAEDWIAEAVWDGNFPDGDFDRTDLVFGTGIRRRGQRLTFVSSGSTLDRIWQTRQGPCWYVANSLPALLAVAGLELLDEFDYAGEMKSICRGLAGCRRTFPTTGEDVHLAYFHNLLYDGRSLVEVDKPDPAPDFDGFEAYFAYLSAAAERLGANLRDPARRHAVVPLTTLSTGYDSPAASVLAMRAGCEQAVTIRDSTSLWRGSDSGEAIGEALGLAVRSYPRTASEYPLEPTIWAVAGRPGILNWTLFDYPQPLCVLFTGSHGDKVWQQEGPLPGDVFEIPSVADLGIGEFRLFRGVFHCPVPFWGIRRLARIRAISASPEMAPWTLGTGYDRPIARRIAEQAGVPRRYFGRRKKNTSLESRFLWPVSADAKASFANFLAERDIRVPPPPALWLMRRADRAYTLFHNNAPRCLRTRLRRNPWRNEPSQAILFHWGNEAVGVAYRSGMESIRPHPCGGKPRRTRRDLPSVLTVP